MNDVKREATETTSTAVLSVAITDADREWAAKLLNFELGKSSWSDRAKAVVKHMGGLGSAEAATGIPEGTWRTWQNRGSRPRDLLEVAAKIGASPGYLDSGRPETPFDFDVEAARLTLARVGFAASGSAPLRRLALQQQVDLQRAAIEEARFEAGERRAPPATPLAAAGVPSGMADQADSIVALPMLVTRLGQAALSDEPSPLGFSRDWLVRQRLDPADLGVVAERDSLFLVDTSMRARALADSCLYAVIDGDAVVICQWQRTATGGGELYLRRPLGLDPRRNPADIVGRVVYVLSPV